MITYPKVTPSKPNTGLLRRGNLYSASYYVDGKRKWTALGTADAHKARMLRDVFYAALAEHDKAKPVVPGRPVTRKTPAQKVAADPHSDIYLRKRKPWTAVVGGKVIAEGSSKAEVRAARNSVLLGENDNIHPPRP